MNGAYWDQLAIQTDKVFKQHPECFDHRLQYPWLVGALGNPSAGIWFIAENPSLTQIERVQNPDGGLPTHEAQWWASRGDKLFRQMLVKHEFKSGTIYSPGGWNCYITNVIKETDYTKNWRAKTQSDRNRIAKIWAPVLAWEISESKPKLVVMVGNQAEILLQHLSTIGKVKLPRVEKITHYAYIGQRAQGILGPMHPQRVLEYDKEFSSIKDSFNKDY